MNRIRRYGCFIADWWHLPLAMVFFAIVASPARAQTTTFTKIYNSGILTLGADESLQLTIVNNNNVADPALPDLPASEETCAYIAQFLDGNGNPLQKQQQTLQPGQNFSFSLSGPQTVQARVDITPGTSSGFAGGIADQCVVSTEILNGSSADAALFPPLFQSLAIPPLSRCEINCIRDCKIICSFGKKPADFCTGCKKSCRSKCG